MPSYTVQSGDTLSGIAAKNGLGGNYQALGYSGDPKSLQPGTVLNWGQPATAAPMTPAPSGSTGGSMLPDVDAAYNGQMSKINDVSAGRDALIASLNSQEDANYKALADKQASQEKMSDAFKRLRSENGLDQLQNVISQFKNQIYSTKSVLNGLDTNINDRTQGTLTTQGQQDRMRQVEGAKINDQLNQLATNLQPAEEAYSAGSNLVGQQLQFMNADQERELQPYKMQIQAFSDRAARQISGYNENAKSLLDTNLAKINQGIQLSTEEWKATQDAAAKERDYAQQFKIASLQAANSIATAKISAGSSAANSAASINATKDMKAAEMGYPSWDAYTKALSSGNGGDRALNELQDSKNTSSSNQSKVPASPFFSLGGNTLSTPVIGQARAGGW